MGRFDGGVRWYCRGSCRVQASFPEGELKCKWCRFCRSDNGGIRYKCFLTDKILYNAETLGDECPLQFEEDDHETV